MLSINSGTRKIQTALNFSTSINHSKRIKILSEASPLFSAHVKCREIWQALQIADYKKEGVLNEAALEVLLEKQGRNLRELLQVKTTEEILDLLDEEELGFLNEDEQILIFSVIKERMQLCAYELCEIHEYNRYKEMMKSIRALENDIIDYQAVLRKRTYAKELKIYQEIGFEKQENFEKSWDQVFKNFEQTCEEKMDLLLQDHQHELENLNEVLQKNTDALKVKPKPIMRNLQIQEKLYAFNERCAEAHQIRNELKVIEIDEQNRVENEILKEQEKRRKKLQARHLVEIEQLKLKNQTNKNKLIIKYEHERIRLHKEIKLHNHDITRNQNLATRLAVVIGKSRDELRRTKDNARNLQKFLKSVKGSKSTRALNEATGSGSLAQKPTLRGTMSMTSNSIGQRTNTKINTATLTKFGIKSDAATDRPINVQPGYMNSTSFSAKTGKLLQQSRKEKNSLPSLTGLYNQKLEPIETLE